LSTALTIHPMRLFPKTSFGELCGSRGFAALRFERARRTICSLVPYLQE
jgi:hypothetical protein